MKKQHGTVLIIVLFIVAITTTIAAEMFESGHFNLRRTANIISNDQAQQYALGAESWAIGILADDFQRDQENNLFVDDNSEAWATVLPPQLLDGGTIEGGIIDLSGRFNLNNLSTLDNNNPNNNSNPNNPNINNPDINNADTNGTQSDSQLLMARATRLFGTLNLEPQLLDTLLDWLDKDINTREQGAEDDYYSSLEKPYVAANQPLSAPSEIALIQGFENPETQKILLDISSTLPINSLININTAPAVVIQSLSDDLTQSDAENIIASRDDTPYNDLNEFIQSPLLEGKNIDLRGISTYSEYFLVYSLVTYDDNEWQLYSLLHRNHTTGIVRVLARTHTNYGTIRIESLQSTSSTSTEEPLT